MWISTARHMRKYTNQGNLIFVYLVKRKGVTAIRNPTRAEPKPKPRYTASRALKPRAARVK
jgi:tryptophan synthase alpha subunit